MLPIFQFNANYKYTKFNDHKSCQRAKFSVYVIIENTYFAFVKNYFLKKIWLQSSKIKFF